MSEQYTVTVPVPGPDGQIRYTNVGIMSPRQHHATGEVVYAITAVSGIIGIFVRFCSRSKPLYKGLRGSEQKLNQAGNRYKFDFPVGATELVAFPIGSGAAMAQEHSEGAVKFTGTGFEAANQDHPTAETS